MHILSVLMYALSSKFIGFFFLYDTTRLRKYQLGRTKIYSVRRMKQCVKIIRSGVTMENIRHNFQALDYSLLYEIKCMLFREYI